MSSAGSKRTAQRRASQGPLGKAKKEIEQLKAALGESRMAVLNMRMMYRQAEQELLVAQQQAQAKETLAAAILFTTGNTELQVTPEDIEDLSESFSGIRVLAAPDGNGQIVKLLTAEELDATEDVDDTGDTEAE